MTTKTMKAAVRDRYGPPEVLRIEEVERPVPKDDEVLVRIRATTVTRTDVHMCAAKPFFWRFMLGLRRPKARILGLEFAGEVEAVGSAVTRFQVGDRVFGLRNGAHAEYVCVGEERLVAHMPDDMTFEEAAAVCDGFYQGLGHLSHAGVGEGTRLAVYGASGSCGTAAVQLGKHHFGAHVTAICNTKNLELVRSLGRGRGRRLPQRGLHEAGRDVRRRPRRGGQALVFPLEARARAAREVRGDGPALQLPARVPHAA